MSDYTLHDSTGRLVARVFTIMRREFDAELRDQGVTIAEWVVLATVAASEVDTPSGIAQFSEIDRAVVTRALDRLTDEKGLAKRELNGEDRRSFTVSLTPTGKRVAKKLLAANKRINERYLEGLSQKEVRDFRRALKRMIDNANAAR